jgi:signal transduction histidine kinase
MKILLKIIPVVISVLLISNISYGQSNKESLVRYEKQQFSQKMRLDKIL